MFNDLDENPNYILDIVRHLAKFKLVENLVNSSLAESTNLFKGRLMPKLLTRPERYSTQGERPYYYAGNRHQSYGCYGISIPRVEATNDIWLERNNPTRGATLPT